MDRIETETRQSLRWVIIAASVIAVLTLLRDLRQLSLQELRVALSHWLAGLRTSLGARGEAEALLSPTSLRSISNEEVLLNSAYTATAAHVGASLLFALLVAAAILAGPPLIWLAKRTYRTTVSLLMSAERVAVRATDARLEVEALAETFDRHVRAFSGELDDLRKDIENLRAKAARPWPEPEGPKRRTHDADEELSRLEDTIGLVRLSRTEPEAGLD